MLLKIIILFKREKKQETIQYDRRLFPLPSKQIPKNPSNPPPSFLSPPPSVTSPPRYVASSLFFTGCPPSLSRFSPTSFSNLDHVHGKHRNINRKLIYSLLLYCIK